MVRLLLGTLSLHNGVGLLATKDEWYRLGLGGLGSIEGLSQVINTAAPEIRLTVSGVDETFMRLVKQEAADYLHRSVTIHAQFFADDGGLLDAPFAIAWGLMAGVTGARAPADDGGWLRTVTISAETPFAGKRRPRNAFLTDRDQQQRFPGDRFAEQTSGIESRTVRFPRF